VAVPGPFAEALEYWPCPHHAAPAPGSRVLVPLGSRQVIGIALGNGAAQTAAERLRPALAVPDPAPRLPPALLELARWAAAYYHHPLGEVLLHCLPPALRTAPPASARARQGESPGDRVGFRLIATQPHAQAVRGPVRARLLALLQQAAPAPVAREVLGAIAPSAGTALRQLVAAGLIEAVTLDATASTGPDAPIGMPSVAAAALAELSLEQAEVTRRLLAALDSGFAPFLLEGVTGSGKTEVYLHAMAETLRRGRQVLLLVPEIGLTPQLLQRCRDRLGFDPVVLHSGLSSRLHLEAWERAAGGSAGLVIGTRSAALMPLPRLGLIVIDEEHDASFKQGEGFRYSARDLALKRAQIESLPIVLGSATPRLESLALAARGTLLPLALQQRRHGGLPPTPQLLDIRNQPLEGGLAPAAWGALEQALQSGGQAMVFLNRRGYAPCLQCGRCGWVADCRHCSAHLVWHRRAGQLRCHHCGWSAPAPGQCPECGQTGPRGLGLGTEQVEAALRTRLAPYPCLRIDRDSVGTPEALAAALQQAHDGSARLLVGTQMLAKGHDWPGLSLVILADADAGLFAADFRGAERLAQQVIQVAGRAGRGDQTGAVLIQTRQPEHPFWSTLLGGGLTGGYRRWAETELQLRAAAGLPPSGYLALLRAAAREEAQASTALEEAARLVADAAGLECIGPFPPPLARRAGLSRQLLLLRAAQRPPLHAALDRLAPALPTLSRRHRCRLNLDVDPQELG